MKDTFAELGLGPELLAELAALGYEEPTPIQKAAIVPLMEGRDLLGQAATGTGKTAAFALPLLQRIGKTPAVALKPFALILVPTRELAVQVSEALHKYSKKLGTSVVPIYGGQEFTRQILALKRGAHIVVATPGVRSTIFAAERLTSPVCRRWSLMKPTKCSTWALRKTWN